VNAQVFLTPAEMGDSAFRGKPVVVIDVLRANTSIAYARAHGAEKVIPIASIEAATRLATSLDRATTLLCGEREGRPISGFDLGNSPLEFTPETVSGKTVIMTTTNGTGTISRLEGAHEIFVCSFVNISAVAHHLRNEAELFIICSGKLGAFSLEDAVCAGNLIARLRDLDVEPLALNDAGAAAEALYGIHGKDLLRCLRGTAHGRYLCEIGFGDDLEVCARADALSTVPVVREGRIT
jgi:2-phosphosulfolactate phosphatase